jgi:hypothetical protein
MENSNFNHTKQQILHINKVVGKTQMHDIYKNVN